MNLLRTAPLAVVLLLAACGADAKKRPQIMTFSASSACIDAGSPVQLQWHVEKAKHCRIDPALERLPTASGSLTVYPESSTKYLLQCQNKNANESQQVEVFVRQSDAQRSLTLTAKYERLPSTSAGLDGDQPQLRPIRAASFELLDICNDAVVARGALDEAGKANVTIAGSNVVRLRVFSEVTAPAIAVVDNTQGQAIYALETTNIDVDVNAEIKVVAASGWGQKDYETIRAAGPFAILDTAYATAMALAAVTDLTFPLLTINWSVDNRPEAGDYSRGEIGTSFWDGEQLYILGQSDVDTDEFDEHVIVHEWGHYFESSFSRADTLGGRHAFGELLDPRVAFSEGWANALSGMILHPDSVYTDSFGQDAATASGFDLEDNSETFDPHPGWFSEASVQSILFDLFDDNAKNSETWDEVSLGLEPIVEVLINYQVATSAFTSIFSFLNGLKQSDGSTASLVNQLTSQHEIDDIVDDFGSNESNAGLAYPDGGGIAENLPVYRDIAVPGSLSLIFAGGEFAADGNKLGQHRYIKIVGNGEALTVAGESTEDIGLFLYKNGQLLRTADITFSGPESLAFNSEADIVYILNVVGFGSESGTYSASIEVQ